MNAPARPDRPIAITVTAEVFDALDALAGRYGLSPSALVANTVSNLATLATLIPSSRKEPCH